MNTNKHGLLLKKLRRCRGCGVCNHDAQPQSEIPNQKSEIKNSPPCDIYRPLDTAAKVPMLCVCLVRWSFSNCLCAIHGSVADSDFWQKLEQEL